MAWARFLVGLMVLQVAFLQAADLNVTVVAENLHQPVAIAVRPAIDDLDPLEVCVAEAGTSRVSLISLEQQGLSPVVVAELTPQNKETASDEADPAVEASFSSGNYRLLFLNQQTLLVARGGRSLRERELQVLRLESESGITTGRLRQRIRELKAKKSDDQSGRYTSLVSSGKYVFASLLPHTGSGYVLRSRHASGTLSALRAISVGTKPAAIRAATIGPNGYFVATVDSLSNATSDGEERVPGSELAFMQSDTAVSGQKGTETRLSLPLQAVVEIAYSPLRNPAEHQLYALVSMAGEGGGENLEAGVYRLDATLEENGRNSIKPELIYAVTDPTAMAFAPDGSLFVSTLGITPGDESPTGSILHLSGSPLQSSYKN